MTRRGLFERFFPEGGYPQHVEREPRDRVHVRTPEDMAREERDAARRAWYRERVRGKRVGPLTYYEELWRRTVEGDASGGWPSGASACHVREPER